MSGQDLTARDYEELERCYISADLACQAQIRRVDSREGMAIVGRKGSGDYNGLVFPYFWPGIDGPREYRLRRDHPELEYKADGTAKPKGKYLSPPGRGNLLYFPPGITPEWLSDANLPVVLTEGEKKGLALFRLALHGTNELRFLPIALPGVWNWRGTVGKVSGPSGERVDVKGPIPDLDRIEWASRIVYILFDADVNTNRSVESARWRLANELELRGAKVFYINLPVDVEVNGIDDLLFRWGPERVLELFECPQAHCLILSPGVPLASAREFVAHNYTQGNRRVIHYHKDVFYVYTGTHYREADNLEVRRSIYTFLEKAKHKGKSGKLVRFHPNKTRVSEVQDALTAVTLLPHEIEAPEWLETPNSFPAKELVACKNGLLHLSTQQLIEHTPTFFGCESLSFSYDPKAADPKNWPGFLDELWPEDPASISTLQQWFGYCLSPDTRQQKMLMIVGPKRSGKGTIGRVQRRLLGNVNVCAPTLSSLTQNFGLEPLIGKRLAIISDARLGGRADQATIAERLLSISGEDAVTIDRKYRKAWTGTLPTRFMILTNELPKILDPSGALTSRFIVLRLTESFLGREDIELTDRLLEELPGILNWAVDGWVSLQERGHFLQPESAAEAMSELENLSSPTSAFIQDRCLIGPDFSVSRDELFEAWRDWCESQGRNYPGTKATFGRDLRSAVPKIGDKRQKVRGGTKRFYQGIGLKDAGL